MLILADKKIPDQALKSLENRGELVLFETNGITYDAISGHPDIFFCKTPGGLIVAPNTPEKYIDILRVNSIEFTYGNNPVGSKYPYTAIYNAVVNDKQIIHCIKYTDNKILELNSNLKVTNVNQAYSRCSCINIKEVYITSDAGIYSVLKNNNSVVIFVNPENIVLKGFKHGFFGGCCGVYDNVLYVAGKLNNLIAYDTLKLIQNSNIKIVELYDGPLYDVGGILFLE
ncbi:MAG: DUF6873 family GME fold protein [Bacteroidota bacterium]